MRKPLFVGNWKAGMSVTDAENYLKEAEKFSAEWKHEVVILPSYLCLDTMKRHNTTKILLGAQDVSQESGVTYTGEIPATNLYNMGCKYALVGHTDRRARGETNQAVNKKILSCLASGITPIVCIGEDLNEYNQNRTREVVEKQLRECLVGVRQIENIVIAYQPVWSIGTGHQIAVDYIALIADYIRKTVRDITKDPMSVHFTLLFAGGPITGATARGFLETPGIDGLMSTIASMKVGTFNEIINTKFEVKRSMLE